MSAQVKLNRAGIRQYLRSDAMRREVAKRAQRIAATAGPGYEASSVIGRNRARASVITGTPEAMIDNSRRNTLIRSLGGAK